MAVQKAPRERAVAELARRQHGVISCEQLIAHGVARGAVHRRLESGRLHPVHRGVYALGHAVISRNGHWMAAVLACGRGALLSHRSAAALWGLRLSARERVDVTAVGRSRHDQPRIDVHRPRRFEDVDRTRRAGIPVTTVARTLLDLAEVVARSELERAFEQAERRELLDLRAVEDVLSRAHGRRGLRPMRLMVQRRRPEVAWTRSELERRFLRLCRSAGLPTPAINTWIEGFEVDALWRDAKLVVELDGWESHRSRSAFERDRERDTALKLAGYEVIRFTYRRLESEPDQAAEAVRKLLAR